MAFMNEAKNEREVEDYLVKEVKKLGGKAYKFNSMSNRAVPDRLCDLPLGILDYVECKAPGEEPTPLQLKVHKEMRSRGKNVYVVDSKFKVDLQIISWKKRMEAIYLKGIMDKYPGYPVIIHEDNQ